MMIRSLPSLRLLVACCVAAAGLAHAQNAEFRGSYARWSPTELVVGNTHVERRWAIRDGALYPTSFADRDAKVEWLAGASVLPSPRTAVLTHGAINIHAEASDASAVEEPSLHVVVDMGGSQTLRLTVFPAANGVMEEFVAPAVSAVAVQQDGVANGSEVTVKGSTISEAALDELRLKPQHLRLTEVTLRDVTDTHNQLASTREWMFMNNEADTLLRGNVMYVEDVLTGNGLVFLKQAPLPDARAISSAFDLRMMAADRTVRVLGGGYPFAVLAFHGGRAGRIRALHLYQRQLRKFDPSRDAAFLSNTWGDRNRDARINAEFIAKEIDAGARLGVDALQIDDGWQAGKSMNSAVKTGGVWSGFWASNEHFWDVDPVRFPQGLKPLVQQAGTHGMKFGLWYAPDSSNDFSNWRRDADRVLSLWRNEGVLYFKFDSIVMSTPAAEANVHRLFDRVLTESKGAVSIDLDVTAGRRPGYFGMVEGGTIFVENRYTDFHRYWPHLTLRNLWQLSEFVDPVRLRMEFLNNTRNTEKYADDPLAPAEYSPDALFATVMMSSPLGWFETSSLPASYVVSAAPLVKTWKQERARMFGGDVQPVGDAPDGVAWTGFISTDAHSKGGYVLLFRERNASAKWAVNLPDSLNGVSRAHVLGGNGTASMLGTTLVVTVPKELGYLWLRVDEEAR